MLNLTQEQKDRFKRLVAALRSGEYKQGRLYLSSKTRGYLSREV